MVKTSSNDFFGTKNFKIDLRVTKKLKVLLSKCWDFTNYPHTAYLKPNPKDYRKLVSFKSESEYIIFLIRCHIVAGKSKSKFWFQLNNPYIQ